MKVLPTEIADKIEQILSQLRRMTEAECIILADTGGQLISVHGQLEKSDPAPVAALAAGDMAAMAELSRQIGETIPCGNLLHEGTSKSIYLLNVADNFILIVVFRTEMLIGIVRLFAGRAAEKLLELCDEFGELLSQPEEALSADFGAALAGELDGLERAFSEPWFGE